MHEVSSGKRSRGLNTVYVHEMDAADLHSGKLTLRCQQGHMTIVTLPIPAFKLLFDFGCSALLDGYPREAATTFASSLERFEEFICRFLLARRNVSFEGVDGAEVAGIVTLGNCFDSELDYNDFVGHHIIRRGLNEPYIPSFVGNTVLSGMWRSNEPREPRPDDDDPREWGLETFPDQNKKNTTDPNRGAY
jgi:hypothetical protein